MNARCLRSGGRIWPPPEATGGGGAGRLGARPPLAIDAFERRKTNRRSPIAETMIWRAKGGSERERGVRVWENLGGRQRGERKASRV